VIDDLRAAVMAERIHDMLANFPNETSTVTFRGIAQQQVRQIGDLDFAIGSIVGTVLLTLLLSTCTMMMQAIREQHTPKLAVLKTPGRCY
jgi:hypothetical protein